MTKRELTTKKLYYGFPIFLLGYQDEQSGYNFSTCSSSYSLGNTVVVGVGKGNAIKQIKKYGTFTINIPNKNAMKQIEIGGFNSRKDKFNLPNSFNYTLSKTINAPIIDECFCTLECRVETIQQIQGYYHIFAVIEHWLVEEEHFEKENQLNFDHFAPVIYMGDTKKRVYRYLDESSSDSLGDFIKQAKED